MHSYPKRTLQDYYKKPSSTLQNENQMFSNHSTIAINKDCSINKHFNMNEANQSVLNHQEKRERVMPYILQIEQEKFLRTFSKVSYLKGNFDQKLLDSCILHQAQSLASQEKQNKPYINGTFILQNGRLYSNKDKFLKKVQFDDQQWLSDQQQIEHPQTTMNFNKQQILEDKQNYNYLEEDQEINNQTIHQIYLSRNLKEDAENENKGFKNKTENYRCSTIEEVTQPSNTASASAMMFAFSQQSGGHIDKKERMNLPEVAFGDCVALHTRRREKL